MARASAVGSGCTEPCQQGQLTGRHVPVIAPADDGKGPHHDAYDLRMKDATLSVSAAGSGRRAERQSLRRSSHGIGRSLALTASQRHVGYRGADFPWSRRRLQWTSSSCWSCQRCSMWRPVLRRCRPDREQRTSCVQALRIGEQGERASSVVVATPVDPINKKP